VPYSQFTLDAVASQLAVLLDDENEYYWTRQEKILAIWEAMLYWGAATSYWRTRGPFNLTPTQPYYDLSVVLPALRQRTWTLQQLVVEIQYMLLEAPNGILGHGMSGQLTVQSILEAIQRARNHFILDTHIPYAANTIPSPPSPDGMATFPQTSVYVHRAAWMDGFTQKWTNLWRQDAWAADKSMPQWTVQQDSPVYYSESENSPLKLQLIPAPMNAGQLEAITVDSLVLDLTNSQATFGVPDEWVHAIKYAALSDLLGGEGQIHDPVRAQYAEMRYQQSVDMARNGRSIIRLLAQGVPLPLDSLAAIDAARPYWRNQSGPPEVAGALYDFLAVAPVPDQLYGMAADVVQSAPLPAQGPDGFLQLGAEDIPHIIDYASHILVFKCGGKEFQDSFPAFDSFMHAVEGRGQINKAKIRYLTPLFAQPEKEQQERPDKLVGAGSARQGEART